MNSINNPLEDQVNILDAVDMVEAAIAAYDPTVPSKLDGKPDSVFTRVALLWGKLGFNVIPGNVDKIPLLESWKQFADPVIIGGAEVTPEMIYAWGMQYGDNISPLLLVSSGKYFGLVGADSDNPVAFPWVEKTFGKTPFEVSTGREGGGKHSYYLTAPGGKVTGRNRVVGGEETVSNWNYEIDPESGKITKDKDWSKTCVDIKAFHNYLVAPGATHKSGRVYTASMPLETLTVEWFKQNVPMFDCASYEAAHKIATERKAAKNLEMRAKVAEMFPDSVKRAADGSIIPDGDYAGEEEPFLKWCEEKPEEVNMALWKAMASTLYTVNGEEKGKAEFHRVSALSSRYKEEQANGIWKTAVETDYSFGPTSYAALKQNDYDGPIPAEEFHDDGTPLDRTKSPAQFLLAQRQIKPMAEAGVSAEEIVNVALKIDPLKLTDIGNARLLVKHFGKDIRFIDSWNHWIVYQEKLGVWKDDPNGTYICAQAKKLAGLLGKEAGALFVQARALENKKEQDNKFKEGEKIRQWALKSAGKGTLLNAAFLARSEPGMGLQHALLDCQPHLLTVANGVVDLKTGKLLEHSRDYWTTKQSLVKFDKDAKAPRWGKFLTEVFPGDPEMIGYVQRALGYTLSGSIREQVMFLLLGSGRNGKGTITQTFNKLLNDWATPASSNLLVDQGNFEGHPVKEADLFGRRMILVNETKDNAKLAENKIKELTGGDSIWCRNINGKPWQFKPTFKLWLSTNNRPKISGRDDGIWTKIHLIPFDISFAGREDKSLGEKLSEELPGILAWAVRGAVQWYEMGLNPPAKCKAALKEYKDKEDTLGYFLKETCYTAKEIKMALKVLYEKYKVWAENSGERAISKIRFSEKLKERGITIERGNANAMTVKGYDLRENKKDKGVSIIDGLCDSDDSDNEEKENQQDTSALSEMEQDELESLLSELN